MEKSKPNRGFGKVLKEYRLSREWSQMDAANHFRVSLMTISRIERNKPFTDLTRAKIENKMKRERQALDLQQTSAVA